jgi:acetyl-CoA synthetase
VDTWWQTETGMILITPLPGLTTTRPGSATHPFPGIEAKILDTDGTEVGVGGGYLAITRPWPAMLRTIWGDHERYVKTYWSRWGKEVYFPGDGAKRDKEGNFWLLGRVDDVMNVAGHRIGTMEVESALVDHQAVAEAAVVGVADELKGTAIAAFVILKEKADRGGGDLMQEIRNHVAKKIGSLAKPDKLFFVADLPKTRSGKIMRRLLRDLAEGRVLGDTTTLADAGILAKLKEQYQDRDA